MKRNDLNNIIAEEAHRLISGDKEALGDIYAETRDYLAAQFRMRFSGYENDVEDMVQDTFVRALEHMESIREPDAYVSWLSTVMINRSKDYLRRNSKTVYIAPNVDDDGNEHDWFEDIPDTSAESDVEDVVCRRERDREVEAVMESLGDRQSALLMMRDAYDMPLREISNVTGIKEGTIKSALSRARCKFRTCYPAA